MAIKLDVARPTQQIQYAVNEGYVFKDVFFDLNLAYTKNAELFKIAETRDIKPIFDAAAIINSIKNILTTSPGEKLLNPTFGVDLRSYLFDVVSETKGFFIGKDIYTGLTLQEPRIKINKIKVAVDIENQEYRIDINLSIPLLSVNGVSLKGVLNNDGYTFV